MAAAPTELDELEEAGAAVDSMRGRVRLAGVCRRRPLGKAAAGVVVTGVGASAGGAGSGGGVCGGGGGGGTRDDERRGGSVVRLMKV